MITDERIVSYIHSLERANSDILAEIEEFAHKEDVPIIRKEMESFLKVMLNIKKPLRILELGTAVGYSAILMSGCIREDAIIDTIENYDKRIPIARENIKKAGKEHIINLIEGDALNVIENMQEKYDFIFMDAAKAQYINYLPHIVRLMNDGAILITDNVLQEGDITESRYLVERRDRTIHSRVREFINAVKNHEQLETTIVPIGDGITMSVKNACENGD